MLSLLQGDGRRIESRPARWLLTFDGLAIQAECRVWDFKRDLALLEFITNVSTVRRPSAAAAIRCERFVKAPDIPFFNCLYWLARTR